MASVLVAGHVCLDLTPSLRALPPIEPGALVDVGPLAAAPGGSVANTGGVLVELGIDVRAQADVGNDPLAEVLVALLRARGIDGDGLRRVAGSTSYSLVLQPPGRDRAFWHHVGANAGFDGDDVRFDGESVLHLGYPPLLPRLARDAGAALVALFRRAGAAGLATSLDLAVVDEPDDASRRHWNAVLDAVLPITDVASPSHDDLASALGLAEPRSADDVVDSARDLVARGAAIAVVSAGARGLALATASPERFGRAGALVAGLGRFWHDRIAFLPARPVDIAATTNGAGDAATAGLLAALLDGATPEAALEHAATTAARRIAGELLAEPASTV